MYLAATGQQDYQTQYSAAQRSPPNQDLVGISHTGNWKKKRRKVTNCMRPSTSSIVLRKVIFVRNFNFGIEWDRVVWTRLICWRHLQLLEHRFQRCKETRIGSVHYSNTSQKYSWVCWVKFTYKHDITKRESQKSATEAFYNFSSNSNPNTFTVDPFYVKPLLCLPRVSNASTTKDVAALFRRRPQISRSAASPQARRKRIIAAYWQMRLGFQENQMTTRWQKQKS